MLDLIKQVSALEELLDSGRCPGIGPWEDVGFEIYVQLQLPPGITRRISELEVAYERNKGYQLMMIGRMAAFMLDECMEITDQNSQQIMYEQCLAIRLQNNDLRDYKTRFCRHINETPVRPNEAMLPFHFRPEIQGHPEFKTYFEQYTEWPEDDPTRSFPAMCARLDRLFESNLNAKHRADLSLNAIGNCKKTKTS